MLVSNAPSTTTSRCSSGRASSWASVIWPCGDDGDGMTALVHSVASSRRSEHIARGCGARCDHTMATLTPS
ncbi:hypothetical protein ACFPRL_05130 [Pseudoclavibacter helvolus]